MLSSSEITTTAATAAVSSSLVVDPSTTTAVKGSSQQQQQQEKPLKMNTYIQLEIDQSNFNCLPRVCKFCVSKLTLMDGAASSSSSNTNHHSHHHHHHHHHSSSHSSSHHHNTPLNSSASSSSSASTSVILAVKLQGSKRSFRTIEIPMHKTPTTTTTDQSPAANNSTNDSKQLQQTAQFTSVDLNLNYNITYPHFIKKDTNVLYFYIQKKKKYKTKTILGYKTLAYTFIDLSTVLQRSFSDQLPLFFRTNTKTSSSSSKSSHHHQRAANVIGTLSIVGLVSQPVDLSIDLEYLTHAQAALGSDYSDNEIHIESNKHKKKTLKKKSRSSSHVVSSKGSGGGVLSKMTTPNASGTKQNPSSSNSSKKFTGKIIQFIRKLKNDNMVTLSANDEADANEEAVAVNDKSNSAVNPVSEAVVSAGNNDKSSTNGVGTDNDLAAAVVVAAAVAAAAAASAAEDADEEENDEEEDDNDEQEADLLDDEQEADHGEENENENEDEDDLDDDEAVSDVDEADLDEFYNIDQISDYTDSDDPVSKGPNYEPDTYSIVSTPKPKLQPFFTNTNTYFHYTGSQYNSTDLLKMPQPASITTTTATTSTSIRNSKQNLEIPIPTSLVLRPNSEQHHHHHHSHHSHHSHHIQHQQNSPNDLYLFYADESDPLTSKLGQALSQDPTFSTKFLLITSLGDLARQFLIMNSNSNNSENSTNPRQLKLLLFANESYNVQKYVQNFYLEILVDTSSSGGQSIQSRIKHYVVMRRSGSFLGTQLARTSPLYQSLFADDWWSKLDWTADLGSNTAAVREISSRFVRYMGVESTRELACQIGELMINQMSGDDLSSKFVPFLSEVRIGFPPDQIQDEVFYTPSSLNSPTSTTTTSQSATTTTRSSLSTSNSTPQFTTVISATNPATSSQTTPQPTTTTTTTNPAPVQSTPPQQQQSSLVNKPLSINTNNQTPKSMQQQQSSPPNSPKISISSSSTAAGTPQTPTPPVAAPFSDDIAYNLQLDYWTNATIMTSLEAQLAQIQHQVPQPLQQLLANYQQQHSSSSQKITQKAWFKSLHVFRTPHLLLSNTSDSSQYLTLVYQIKEKKQKIMRLSKKTKDNENKKEVVEGLTRLVCTSKNHTTLLNVYVDDLEYDNIKFLQISSLWRGKAAFFNFTLPSIN